ncbi:cysteine peptidase family C39 domain-containing protein [Cellulosilyticum sp. WCF-2]|uniref:cysteine peptidase family C39 domain-containing protein n=1 Tax=Cellulosilyticum sp. ST5 TaxID=3055805 RepID=UPI000F8CC335|nr:hypothetical protein EKH84_03380 [Cellulosilyticum sp. WCF-2]
MTKIGEVVGTDTQGTNIYGVIKATEQLGINAKREKGNQEDFFRDFPLLAILHVIVEQLVATLYRYA